MSENITPAQEAWFDYRKDCGSWPEPELCQVHKHFVAGYEAAQADKAPSIAAKAEALREAAESFQGVMIGIGGRDPRTSGAAWLRARAELIERKGS